MRILRLAATSRVGSAPWISAGCGALIGVLAVATWLSWTLSWSDDRALACAAILVGAVGLAIGGTFPLSRYLGQLELAIAACICALVQPWLIAGLILTIRWLPLETLASDSSRLMLGLVVALPTWFLSCWLWSSLAMGTAGANGARPDHNSAQGAGFAFGFGAGSGFCVFVLGPLIGAWGSVACAVAVILLGWGVNSMGRWPAVAVASGVTPPVADERLTVIARSTFDTVFGTVLSLIAALVIGGLFAVVMRLVGQLMPNGSQMYVAELMGCALGFGVQQSLARRPAAAAGTASSASGSWIMLAAVSTGLLIVLPAIIRVSFWATASLTSVGLLMSFRVLLLVAATAPAGYAVSRLLPSLRGRPGGWLVSLPLATGFIAAQASFQSLGLVALLGTCTSVLVLLGLAGLVHPVLSRPSLGRPGLSRPSWRGAAGLAGCALVGLSVPLFSAHDDPARMSKLLFSTPAFVAHRAGWESHLLTVLDDARVIDRREGRHGPLTLWRSHGMELHLRDNGIPRAVISANTEAHPQFAPEVLQAVFPLVMVRQPRQILLLGASGGVPLATCLRFPVLQVTCVESDPQLMELIRGPLAHETGDDPFSDARTRLVTTPPAVAVMGRTEPFDVILSSPPASSVIAGGAMFTADHYRNASRCLAEGGIFCQRFECVDYGPQPLRTIVQSMRQAFREVIAIETAAGEFLLLGTNTAGVFVPEEMPARLEAPHVRRLLAHSGLDWSALLNFPAYDHAALGEICSEVRTWTNLPANGILALQTPLELMRWGAKLREVQTVLTAPRTSPAPFLSSDDQPESPPRVLQMARKSRFLEWLGDDRISPEVLRRLSDVATQHKLVYENPESHWWEYRKALRQELQKRARSLVQQVNHSTDDTPLHPDDERRKSYFVALGEAARQPQPSAEQIEAVAAHLNPYDPLLSYFARQEIADLQSRGQMDAAEELVNRLHVVYFAPGGDGSTRNVSAALELLARHPDAIPDPSRRFDMLNGLVQTLRSRWETRQSHSVKSPRRQMSDVDRSIVAIEKAVLSMESLYPSAQLTDADWEHRKQVIERLLLRPLRTHRGQLQVTATRSEGKTRAAIEAASSLRRE